MTFTLLREYPASSKLAIACSTTLSHTSCISVASCSCHLSKKKLELVDGSDNEEYVGLPRVWVVLRKLLLALRHDIRILIKDDESGRAASRLSTQMHARGGLSRI
jgi:hypothetical protein